MLTHPRLISALALMLLPSVLPACGESSCPEDAPSPFTPYEETKTIAYKDYLAVVGPDGELDAAACSSLCGATYDVRVRSCTEELQTQPGYLRVRCSGEKGFPCEGRRHREWQSPPEGTGADAVGAHLARAASAEAASSLTFSRIEGELRSLGAPASLLQRVRCAAADEVFHARIVGAVASQHHGRVEAVSMVAPGAVVLYDVAVDNAVYGCVQELLAALTARYQSQRAATPQLRALYSAIADDELTHAQLAWDLAAWLEEQMSSDARLAVQAARLAAIEAAMLATDDEDELDHATQTTLGLPPAQERRRWAEALRQQWAA